MAERTGRSLSLTTEQQAKADIALSKFGSKRDLAADLQMSPTTITNFFAGRPVQRKIFHAICKKLKLDWQPEPVTQQQTKSETSNVDELVREVRDAIRPLIQEKCGKMRVLDMSQWIALGEIYTHVNILEKPSGRTRRELAELMPNVSPEAVERFGLGAVREQRIPGLEAVEKYDKLMILGKPGAGKTTFLKHLAIACSGGEFQSHRVPLFITLKEFAETEGQPDLLAYCDRWVNPRSPGHNSTAMLPILDNGRALILLDGLDEVRESDASRVLRQIQQFSERYSRNAFIITCRIAAREYTFQQFTDVEIADFDDAQIADVSGKWFRCKQDEVKAKRFLQKLQENPRIRDLASSPLLLTLLCLVFEDSGDFPANRAELYQNGVDVLLKKWDVKRNIERDQIYKKLSLKRKEDLLSQIAWRTFASGNYFFKQTDLEQQIREFIEHLPGASTDEDTLTLDSVAVLKSIEAQHGLFVERAYRIYSFSHLTFHEYFAAREAKEKSYLTVLTHHLTDERWREVMLLTVQQLPNADVLLKSMKQTTDQLLAGDDQLQAFLQWLDEKAQSVDITYKPMSAREFYFGLPIVIGLFNHFDYLGIDITLPQVFYLDSALEFALERATACAYAIDNGFDPDCDALDLDFSRHEILDLAHTQDPNLYVPLKYIIDQLPDQSHENRRNFNQWWQANGKDWTLQLQTFVIRNYNIGHDWQFSHDQTEKLRQYYNANQLLVDCLNSGCYVSREVRQEIEDTLLLPIVEIEQRRKPE